MDLIGNQTAGDQDASDQKAWNPLEDRVATLGVIRSPYNYITSPDKFSQRTRRTVGVHTTHAWHIYVYRPSMCVHIYIYRPIDYI